MKPSKKRSTAPDLSHIAEPLRPLAVPLDSLVKDPANARLHDQRNIDAIKASLKAFGQRKPIVVRASGRVIEAGNGTFEAAQQLLEEDPRWAQVAVVVADDDTVTAAAFSIADNRTAELARWDQKALPALLQSIQQSSAEAFSALGFSDDEVAALITEIESDNARDEHVPEPPAKAITKRGDLWMLGNHRVLCGDSTSAADVDRLMDGARADLCVTSPPYNVGLCYPCITDRLPKHEYLKFIKSVAEQAYRILAPGRFIAWNLGVSPATYVAHQVVALEELGFRFYRQIIWAKTGVRWPNFQATQKLRRARKYSPNYTHEVIEVLVRPGGEGEDSMCACPLCDGGGQVPQIDLQAAYSYDTVQLLTKGNEPEPGGEIHPLTQYANDVWKISQSMATRDLKTIRTRGEKFKNRNNTHCVKEHPATFPVEVPRAVMAFLTAKGEAIYEPFCGTGSTLIAAERMGRRCYGMELVPAYVDIIVRRWEERTGEKATRVPATRK